MFRLLKNKVAHLEEIIEILQSVTCTAKSPLKEKLYAAEQLHGKYNVHMNCDALDKYIIFYNAKRPHKKLQYKTPEQKEMEYALKQVDMRE